MEIGVQSKNVVMDEDPFSGFQMLKKTGFSCVDFSLNSYLENTALYREEKNDFLTSRTGSWRRFLHLIKRAQKRRGSGFISFICLTPIMYPMAAGN